MAVVLLAIPVAVFHFVAGRFGNGIMCSGAILAGMTLVIIDLRTGAAPHAVDDTEVDAGLDPDDYWWPDGADHLDDDTWLDRLSDEPLPAPFQAVMDELQRERARE